MKQRVLHALHTFPPATHGGIETYVADIGRVQAERGHEPVVVCGSDLRDRFGEPREECVGGLEVHRLPTTYATEEIGVSDVARSQVVDLAVRLDVDLVHLHHWHGLSIDVVAALTKHGIPCVVTLHDFFPTCPLFFRLRNQVDPCPSDLDRKVCVEDIDRLYPRGRSWIEDGLLRRERTFRNELASASARLAISGPQRDLLIGVPWLAGLDIDVLRLPPPRLPPPAAGPAPRDPAFDLRVVTWGGLDPGKGLHVLIDACKGLRDPSRVALHHYGRVLDVGYQTELLAAASRVRLVFAGRFTTELQCKVFPRYDLAVFPSLYMETHGYAVDEAMLCGLPVIVTDRGAPQERIGARGRVVQAGNRDALAAVLQELIDDRTALVRLRDAPLPKLVTHAEHADALDEVYARAVRSSHGA